MLIAYSYSLWGLWLILLTVFLQGFIATVIHRRQSRVIPGKVDDSLGHESLVFRSHRTHQNSLDNLPVFVLPALLAMFAGVSPKALAVIVWVYALARVVHMVLYYAIATERNPSPRSYFFIIGWLANIALFVMVAYALLSR